MARVQRASEGASWHLLAARRSKAQNGMLHVLEEDLKREVQLTQTRFDYIIDTYIFDCLSFATHVSSSPKSFKDYSNSDNATRIYCISLCCQHSRSSSAEVVEAQSV